MTLKEITEKHKLPIEVKAPRGYFDFTIVQNNNDGTIKVAYSTHHSLVSAVVVADMEHINDYEVISSGGLM